MIKLIKWVAIVASLFVLCSTASGLLLSYQGKMTDSSDLPISDPDRVMSFAIYDTSEAGTALWAETLSIEIVNGLFDVEFGTVHPLNLDFDGQYYLEIKIDGNDDGDLEDADDETFLPRERLIFAPYAFRSVYADSAGTILGLLPPNDYIWNQDTLLQTANARINGIAAWSIMRANPEVPDSFPPQVGMIKSTYNDSTFYMFVYDGTCYRLWYPQINTQDCFGIPLSVEIGFDDTTLYDASQLNLTAATTGGFRPYLYDWNTDGTGDWDDPQSIIVNLSETETVIVQVRDFVGDTVSDTAVVNIVSAPYFNAGFKYAGSYGAKIVFTQDSGFCIAAHINSSDGTIGGMLLTKLNKFGFPQWAREYRYNDIFLSGNFYTLYETSDSGFVAGGYIKDSLNQKSAFAMKVDKNGNLEWARTYGRWSPNNYYQLIDIIQTSDNAYLAILSQYSDTTYIAKTNSSGVVQWARRSPGKIGAVGTGYVLELLSGNYLMIARDSYYRGVVLAQLTPSGGLVWRKRLRGLFNAYGVALLSDGSLALSGYPDRRFAWCPYGNAVVRLNSSFTSQIFGKIFCPLGGGVLEAEDGNIVIFGNTQAGRSYDVGVASYSPTGTLRWAKVWGGGGIEKSASACLYPGTGKFYIAGVVTSWAFSSFGLFIANYDTLGNSCGGAEDLGVVDSNWTVTVVDTNFTLESTTLSSVDITSNMTVRDITEYLKGQRLLICP